MKSKPKQKLTDTLNELRSNLLAAIAEMDLTGTDSKVTQAMFIIEEAFNFTAKGQQVIPRRTFRLGSAKAKASERI
ncbi:MAG: hypothetical protein WDM76_15120 [Limisphaerales bacterium]